MDKVQTGITEPRIEQIGGNGPKPNRVSPHRTPPSQLFLLRDIFFHPNLCHPATPSYSRYPSTLYPPLHPFRRATHKRKLSPLQIPPINLIGPMSFFTSTPTPPTSRPTSATNGSANGNISVNSNSNRRGSGMNGGSVAAGGGGGGGGSSKGRNGSGSGSGKSQCPLPTPSSNPASSMYTPSPTTDS